MRTDTRTEYRSVTADELELATQRMTQIGLHSSTQGGVKRMEALGFSTQ